MARLFASASSEYLAVESAPVVTTPLTMACWFYLVDHSVEYPNLMCLGTSGSANHQYTLFLGEASYLKLFAQARTTSAKSAVKGDYAVGAWQHACGVFASATSRTAYLDGAAGTENTDSKAPSDTNTFLISSFEAVTRPVGPINGYIAEAAVWDVAISSAEVAFLGNGYSPLFVRPQSLVAYWPLIRDEDQDRVGGFDLTPVNTPTIATHPRVIYPAPVWVVVPAAAGVADLTISVSDAITAGETTTVTVSDPQVLISEDVTIAEAVTASIAAVADLAISVSDGITAGETTTALVSDLPASVADSIAIAEAVTMLVTSFIDVSDTAAIAETTTVAIVAVSDLSIDVSDGVTVAEATTATVSDPQVSVNDTATIAETVTMFTTSFISVAEAVTVGEDTTVAIVAVSDLSIDVSDGITAGEATTALVSDPQVSVADTATIAEATTMFTTSFISVNDTAAIAETTTVAIVAVSDLSISVSDGVTVADTPALLITELSLSVAEAVSVADTPGLLITELFVSPSETISVSDSPTISIPVPVVDISISISDTITVAEVTTLAIILAVAGNKNAAFVTFRDKRKFATLRDKRNIV